MLMFFWKDKNKRKRDRGWPIFLTISLYCWYFYFFLQLLSDEDGDNELKIELNTHFDVMDNKSSVMRRPSLSSVQGQMLQNYLFALTDIAAKFQLDFNPLFYKLLVIEGTWNICKYLLHFSSEHHSTFDLNRLFYHKTMDECILINHLES